jgi:hypothetical protein
MRAIIILITVATAFGAAGCGGEGDGGGATAEHARDAAVKAAKTAFAQARSEGVDLANGPCLGTVAPDWVADVAHNPRQPVDDEPANQCEAYRSGAAHHFVELDLNGNLIRAQ